jgi:DNA-binding GntR family transcriptional regulator
MDIGVATVSEHQSILDAIRARDAGGAEAAMLAHINRSRERSEGARVRSGNRAT